MVASYHARRIHHKNPGFYYIIILIHCIAWVPRATLQAPAVPAKYGFVHVGTAATWTAAEADCVSRGGHLASISTAADNQQVQTLCSQKLPTAQLRSPANSGCWIGLNDQATEATYVWTDGTPFNYTAWHQGPNLPQPDDDKQTQYDEDCVLFVVDSVYLGWHDWGCADRQTYVCKVPISQSPSPSPSPAANTTQPSPSPAPVVVSPPAANDTSSSSSNSSSTAGTAPTGSTSPSSPTSTGTSSPTPTTASTSAGGGVTTASDTANSGQFVTGTVPSISTSTSNPSSTASSLTGAASTTNSNNQSATASSTSSGGDNSDKWKLVISIVVPVLTGVAALITIAYTGWKWWHKRQATLARRRGVGLVPNASTVKPLIAVNV